MILVSWAVSFGMPSKPPDSWCTDMESTRKQLPAGKLLCVSVVGTVCECWSIDDLADDYARCASWAVESSADCIETNFSCPNVSTCDGQLYQQTKDAALVADQVRQVIGTVPYFVKLGHLASRDHVMELTASLAGSVDVWAMTDSVAATVTGANGKLLFDGAPRGICGDGIHQASIEQVGLASEVAREQNARILLVGVGGTSTAEHVQQYQAAGANAIHVASAAMVNPSVVLRCDDNGMLVAEVGDLIIETCFICV